MHKYISLFAILSFCFGIDQTALDLGFKPTAGAAIELQDVIIDQDVTTDMQTNKEVYNCKSLHITDSGVLRITNSKRFKNAKAALMVSKDFLMNGQIKVGEGIHLVMHSSSFNITDGNAIVEKCTIVADEINIANSIITSQDLFIGGLDSTNNINIDADSTITVAPHSLSLKLIAANIALYGKIYILSHYLSMEFSVTDNLHIADSTFSLYESKMLRSELTINSNTGEFNINVDSLLTQTILQQLKTFRVVIKADHLISVDSAIELDETKQGILTLDAPQIRINGPISYQNLCLTNSHYIDEQETEKEPARIFLSDLYGEGQAADRGFSTLLSSHNLTLDNAVIMDGRIALLVPTNLCLIDSSMHLTTADGLQSCSNDNSILIIDDIADDFILDKYEIVNNIMPHAQQLIDRAKTVSIRKFVMADGEVLNAPVATYLIVYSNSKVNLDTLGNITHIEKTMADVNVLHITPETILEKYTVLGPTKDDDPLFAIAKFVSIHCATSVYKDLIKLNLPKARKLSLEHCYISLASAGILSHLSLKNAAIVKIDHIPADFKLTMCCLSKDKASFKYTQTFLPARTAIFNGYVEQSPITETLFFDKTIIKKSKIDFAGGLITSEIQNYDSIIRGNYPRHVITYH